MRLPDKEDKKPAWDETFDIVVIGSGFAGLAAAIEARDSGASVLVIEKMNAPGGNSLISDGGIAAAGTEEQKKAGIEDSPELLYADMMKAGLGINYPELVKILAENSRQALEWSRDCLGVPYMDRLDIFGGHSVARCFTADKISGLTIIKKQVQKLKELGVEIRFRTAFTELIMDAKGRICGIRAGEDYSYKTGDWESEKNIRAEKAVILAAGGFGSDIRFRSAQDPRLTESIGTTNQPSATAEVLKEAMRAGAATVQLSQIQLGPWASPDERGYGDGPMFSEYIVFQKGIIVDPATGKRIVNELADRKVLSDSILQAGRPCTGIADSRAVRESGWDISRCIKKNVVRAFDSLARLAAAYTIDEDRLAETVERFNTFVKNRHDPDFGKPVIETAAEISEPPFYAIRLWPKVHHTMGGLRINTEAQVLDLDGNPIRGLYAAGEITGGVHGASRLGSCAITDCFVFGRIAGRNGAAEKSTS